MKDMSTDNEDDLLTDDLLSEEVLQTSDAEKIVDIASRRPKKPTARNQNKERVSTPDKFKRMFREAALEKAKYEARQLTEDEQTFVDLIIAGESMSMAFAHAFPDKINGRNGKPLTIEQLWDRGDKLANTVKIRSEVRLRLEKELGDTEHTSLRLHNFIMKRLEHEASYSNPAGRLKALAMLRDYGAVAAVDKEAEKQAQKTSEEIMAEFEKKLSSLKA